jgi:hypothetical protein
MKDMFYDFGVFNQNLSGWCVAFISNESTNFSEFRRYWIEPQPICRNCPEEIVKLQFNIHACPRDVVSDVVNRGYWYGLSTDETATIFLYRRGNNILIVQGIRLLIPSYL